MRERTPDERVQWRGTVLYYSILIALVLLSLALATAVKVVWYMYNDQQMCIIVKPAGSTKNLEDWRDL
jgi:hypothetical protein